MEEKAKLRQCFVVEASLLWSGSTIHWWSVSYVCAQSWKLGALEGDDENTRAAHAFMSMKTASIVRYCNQTFNLMFLSPSCQSGPFHKSVQGLYQTSLCFNLLDEIDARQSGFDRLTCSLLRSLYVLASYSFCNYTSDIVASLQGWSNFWAHHSTGQLRP